MSALRSKRSALRFRLSPFERDLLALCAGVELDAGIASLCAEAQGDPQRVSPTFSLALAALPGAHWSALAPDAPLRYWRLIEPAPGGLLTRAPLRIDERVLHYLTGISYLDERLRGLMTPIRVAEAFIAVAPGVSPITSPRSGGGRVAGFCRSFRCAATNARPASRSLLLRARRSGWQFMH